MSKDNLRIAIIGGGIAGLYCAWRLGGAPHSNHKIVLYEYLNHLGGRIETVPLGGFSAECGPMRFELAVQRELAKLLLKLGIDKKEDFRDFPKTEPVKVEHPKYKLQKNETYGTKPDGEDDNATSFELLQYGLYRIFNQNNLHLSVKEVVTRDDNIKSLIQKYADNLSDSDYEDIRKTAKLDKQLLHKLGIWNALARVLSPQALLKLREIGTFYHLIPENPSASEWAIFWLRLCRSDSDLVQIRGGVDRIIKLLEEEIRMLENVELNTGIMIQKIDRGSSERKISLSLSRNRNEVGGTQNNEISLSPEFDHVILAIPKIPLLRLMDLFPSDVCKYIDGVIAFPLLKAFVTLKKRWWTDENPRPQRGAPLIPTREIHYFNDKHTNRGMVMLYTDRPATSYWSLYIESIHQKAQIGYPNSLKHDLAERIFEILKSEYIESKILLEKELAQTKSKILREDKLHLTEDKIFLKEPYLSAMADFVRCEEYLYSIEDEEQRKNALKSRDESMKKAIRKIENQIAEYAIRDWSKLPFGAANHAWSPHIVVPDALDRLKKFSLMGSPGNDNLHICGEAYSDYQGFIEGALLSSNAVLKTIDPRIEPLEFSENVIKSFVKKITQPHPSENNVSNKSPK